MIDLPDKEKFIEIFDKEHFTDLIDIIVVYNDNCEYDFIVRGTNMWTNDLIYEICQLTESNVIDYYAHAPTKTWLCTFKKIDINE